MYFEQIKLIFSFFFYFQHPKRTKPKGLIDLSCAFLYTVHESFFDKRHCFQLVEKALPCLATVTYLSAEDVGELEDWLSGMLFFNHFQKKLVKILDFYVRFLVGRNHIGILKCFNIYE